MGDVQMDTVQLDTSQSQRLNSGKSLGTGRCEWLWASARCPSEPLPNKIYQQQLWGNSLGCHIFFDNVRSWKLFIATIPNNIYLLIQRGSVPFGHDSNGHYHSDRCLETFHCSSDVSGSCLIDSCSNGGHPFKGFENYLSENKYFKYICDITLR